MKAAVGFPLESYLFEDSCGEERESSTVNWVDKYSKALQMPEATRKQMILKYTTLVGIHKDFVTAAVGYAKTIISEYFIADNLKSLKTEAQRDDMGGRAGGKKFTCHNILFKLATGEQTMYDGSDEYAAKAMGHEINGANHYLRCDLPDINIALQCLVDYKGFRMLCQAELPIGKTSLAIGSSDGGKTICCMDDKLELASMFNQFVQAAEKLNIAKHWAKGKVLYSAIDVEGHIVDGKYYLVDLARVFPPEAPQVSRHLEQQNNFRIGQNVRYRNALKQVVPAKVMDRRAGTNGALEYLLVFLRPKPQLLKWVPERDVLPGYQCCLWRMLRPEFVRNRGEKIRNKYKIRAGDSEVLLFKFLEQNDLQLPVVSGACLEPSQVGLSQMVESMNDAFDVTSFKFNEPVVGPQSLSPSASSLKEDFEKFFSHYQQTADYLYGGAYDDENDPNAEINTHKESSDSDDEDSSFLKPSSTRKAVVPKPAAKGPTNLERSPTSHLPQSSLPFMDSAQKVSKPVALSSDALTRFCVGSPDFDSHNKNLVDATRILILEVIPAVAHHLMVEAEALKDHQTIPNCLHFYGVNIRHCGLLRCYLLEELRVYLESLPLDIVDEPCFKEPESSPTHHQPLLLRHPSKSDLSPRTWTLPGVKPLSCDNKELDKHWCTLQRIVILQRKLLQECVVRTLKCMLREVQRKWMKSNKTSCDAQLKEIVVRFFNLLTGTSAKSKEFWQIEVSNSLKERFGAMGLCCLPISSVVRNVLEYRAKKIKASQLPLEDPFSDAVTLLTRLLSRNELGAWISTSPTKLEPLYSARVEANSFLPANKELDLWELTSSNIPFLYDVVSGVLSSTGVRLTRSCYNQLKDFVNEGEEIGSTRKFRSLSSPRYLNAVESMPTSTNECRQNEAFEFVSSDIDELIPVVRRMYHLNVIEGQLMLLKAEERILDMKVATRLLETARNMLIKARQIVPDDKNTRHILADCAQLRGFAMQLNCSMLKRQVSEAKSPATCRVQGLLDQRIGFVSLAYEEAAALHRDLGHTRCSVSKLTFTEDILGLIMKVKHFPTNDKCSALRIKSVKLRKECYSLAYFQDKRGEQFPHHRFFPLVFNECRGAEALLLMEREINEMVRTTQDKYTFVDPPSVLGVEPTIDPGNGFIVISSIMNGIVLTIALKKSHEPVDEYLANYMRMHHVLLFLAHRDKESTWHKNAQGKVELFLSDPEARKKQKEPDLGRFLINLLLSGRKWDVDIAEAIFLESVTRQVSWLVQPKPPRKEQDLNESTSSDTASALDSESEDSSTENQYRPELMELERDDLSLYRLFTTFSVTSVSRRIVMFQISFLRLAQRTDWEWDSDLMPEEELLQMYNASFGFPLVSMRRGLKEICQEIYQVSDYGGFLRHLGLTYTPEEMTKVLRNAVRNACRIKYVRPYYLRRRVESNEEELVASRKERVFTPEEQEGIRLRWISLREDYDETIKSGGYRENISRREALSSQFLLDAEIEKKEKEEYYRGLKQQQIKMHGAANQHVLGNKGERRGGYHLGKIGGGCDRKMSYKEAAEARLGASQVEQLPAPPKPVAERPPPSNPHAANATQRQQQQQQHRQISNNGRSNLNRANNNSRNAPTVNRDGFNKQKK